jgi:hypothetical protein
MSPQGKLAYIETVRIERQLRERPAAAAVVVARSRRARARAGRHARPVAIS